MWTITPEQIATAGVVGAGGAGFPTHVKLSGQADTVVINAAECEPLLHKDKELILHDAPRIVEGLEVAMKLVKAQRGVFGIKRKYAKVIDTLRPFLSSRIDIVPMDDAYPAGDEFMLVHQTLGRVIPPGAIPLTVGAVVLNVETCYNLAGIEEGPVIRKYVSVAGAVRNPCTVCAPIGASLAACLAAAGGATIDDPAYIIGGVMMGYLANDLSEPVTKTTGGIIVLPKDNFVVQRKGQSWEHTSRIGRAACDQCSHCTELCPRYLLGHPIEPHRTMRSLGFNLSYESNVAGSLFCSECNLCSYCSCPEDLDPKSINAQNKRRIIAEKKQWKNPPFIPERADSVGPFRKTPTSRLIQRLGLSGFTNKGPLLDREVDVDSVVVLLRQHIGVPTRPVVDVGQSVVQGEVIGKRPVIDGKIELGADVHASIDGKVTAVTEHSVVIQR